MAFPDVSVQVFDEKEDTTHITSATLLQVNQLKRWIIVPLLSFLSVFIFPLYIYWKRTLQRDWLFSRASSLESATHVYV